MEQHRGYWEDTYLFDVDTEVVAVREQPAPGIAVRDGIVHPKGGGQPADLAAVDTRPVSVSKDTETVWLHPEGTLPAFGDVVRVAIDPEVRRRRAALHSAGHLLDDVDGGALPDGEEAKAALITCAPRVTSPASRSPACAPRRASSS